MVSHSHHRNRSHARVSSYAHNSKGTILLWHLHLQPTFNSIEFFFFLFWAVSNDSLSCRWEEGHHFYPYWYHTLHKTDRGFSQTDSLLGFHSGTIASSRVLLSAVWEDHSIFLFSVAWVFPITLKETSATCIIKSVN